jgi:hypothetical protein
MKKQNGVRSRLRLPDVSDAYVKDVGTLAALVLLALHLWRGSVRLVFAAATVLLLTVLAPGFFKPLARLWLAGSRLLGAFMSRLLLSAIYFVLLTPLAWMSRLFRHDPLRLRLFKKSGESVFVNRAREYAPGDLKKPY